MIVWLPRQAELWTSPTPQLGAFFLPLVLRELCVFDNENDVNSFSVPQDKLALVTFIEWRSARGPLDNAVPVYLPVYNSLFCTLSKKKINMQGQCNGIQNGQGFNSVEGPIFSLTSKKSLFQGPANFKFC